MMGSIGPAHDTVFLGWAAPNTPNADRRPPEIAGTGGLVGLSRASRCAASRPGHRWCFGLWRRSVRARQDEGCDRCEHNHLQGNSPSCNSGEPRQRKRRGHGEERRDLVPPGDAAVALPIEDHRTEVPVIDEPVMESRRAAREGEGCKQQEGSRRNEWQHHTGDAEAGGEETERKPEPTRNHGQFAFKPVAACCKG